MSLGIIVLQYGKFGYEVSYHFKPHNCSKNRVIQKDYVNLT